MHHQPKSHILNMSDWADAVTALVRHFAYVTLEPYVTDSQTLHDLTTQWTMKHSIQWTQAQLDDEFNRQLMWARSTNASDAVILEYLTALFKDHMGDVISDAAHQETLLHDVIELTDPVVVLISEVVSDLVSPNPWWVWSMRYRYDIVLIESDEDYRVKIFNDKIESGEWSL
jgi:hypothetical protein